MDPFSFVDVCSTGLALVASRCPPWTHQQFAAAVVEGEEPVLLLRFMWSTRMNSRSRRAWSTVLADLRADCVPRYAQQLLSQTYAFYSLLRTRAIPCQEGAPVHRPYTGYMPRALIRMLRRHAVCGLGVEERRSLTTRAAELVSQRWDDLVHSRVVIWFDNYYRARYLNNPARGYSTLNSTVLALLHLPTIPSDAPDIVRLPDALARVSTVLSDLLNCRLQLEDMVAVCRRQRYLPGEVRVPLDVQRENVLSLPWLPLQVFIAIVSSQVGLLRYLRFAGRISARTTTRVAPMLVDVNIHYRVMKMAWGTPFLRWDIARYLQTTPPLYGLWHSYKYCVVQVARHFHSCLWYCVRGSQRTGAVVATSQTLRFFELMFAAILQMPLSVRDGVHDTLNNWVELVDSDEQALQMVAASSGHNQQSSIQLMFSMFSFPICNAHVHQRLCTSELWV
jgi:hypothetical protein